MEALPPSLYEVEHNATELLEERVRALQQQFIDRRQAARKADQERKASGYNAHYVDVPDQAIALIDQADLRMLEDIQHIASPEELQQVKSEFDEYFLRLEQPKKMIAVILYHELLQQVKFMKKRAKAKL